VDQPECQAEATVEHPQRSVRFVNPELVHALLPGFVSTYRAAIAAGADALQGEHFDLARYRAVRREHFTAEDVVGRVLFAVAVDLELDRRETQ
jgi:hypothetical protein